jgi:hypothetical protein
MSMYRKFLREVASVGLPEAPVSVGPAADQPPTLPQAAQRYLRFMNVDNRTPEWSFRPRSPPWPAPQPSRRCPQPGRPFSFFLPRSRFIL